LNTLLLQGNPLGTLPYSIFERLEADERVALAVPLAFGDNIGGASIIGTSSAFFELRTDMRADPYFQLRTGEFFDEPFEAVLGHVAAQRLNLQIGDQFLASHGAEAGLGKRPPSRGVYGGGHFESIRHAL
jgi:putative ABC transport system permease protein